LKAAGSTVREHFGAKNLDDMFIQFSFKKAFAWLEYVQLILAGLAAPPLAAPGTGSAVCPRCRAALFIRSV